MSMTEKKYDPMASILNSIDNLADKLMEYQNDKKEEARGFARKIDELFILARKVEDNEKRKRRLRYPKNDEERKKYEQEIEKINEEAKKLEEASIDTVTVLNGILSSPAGNDMDFITQSTTYLRQKSNERNKPLTSKYLQDLRDSFLIRSATDSKIWDIEFREMFKRSFALIQNIALGYRKSEQERERGTAKEITEEKPEPKRNSNNDEYSVN